MKLSLVKGTTSKIVHIFIQSSAVSTGAGLTGLVFNSASLVAYYIRPGDASPTAITLATATVGSFTSGGFKEVDATNMPGVYELGIPNACLATGANQVVIMLKGATNMAPVLLEIELTAWDNQSATSGGLSKFADIETDTQDLQSRLPAALGANGNIKADIRDFSGTAGTFASGRPEVNASHFAGTAYATALAAEIDAIFDELLSGHTTAGTAGAQLTLIRRMLQNRVEHSGTTVTLYADDGITPLLTAQVKNDGGTAINSSSYASTTPAERTALA